MTGKGALEHFTGDVVSGRVCEQSLMVLFNIYFKAATDAESWEQLNAWARTNGIGITTELREMRPRKRETWVMFAPRR